MAGAGNHCQGIRANGQPCRSTAVDAEGYCFAHSPRNSPAERKAARARGGANRSTAARAAKALPADLAGVSALILRSLAAVETEMMEPKTATAIAALASCYVRIHEAGEQEARIVTLEEQVQTVRRRS